MWHCCSWPSPLVAVETLVRARHGRVGQAWRWLAFGVRMPPGSLGLEMLGFDG